jgi:hypothetical protein
MGFSEALSDDGKLSGCGNPWLRGVVCGLMTFLGALGHTLIGSYISSGGWWRDCLPGWYSDWQLVARKSEQKYLEQVSRCSRWRLPFSRIFFK